MSKLQLSSIDAQEASKLEDTKQGLPRRVEKGGHNRKDKSTSFISKEDATRFYYEKLESQRKREYQSALKEHEFEDINNLRKMMKRSIGTIQQKSSSASKMENGEPRHVNLLSREELAMVKEIFALIVTWGEKVQRSKVTLARVKGSLNLTFERFQLAVRAGGQRALSQHPLLRRVFDVFCGFHLKSPEQDDIGILIDRVAGGPGKPVDHPATSLIDAARTNIEPAPHATPHQAAAGHGESPLLMSELGFVLAMSQLLKVRARPAPLLGLLGLRHLVRHLLRLAAIFLAFFITVIIAGLSARATQAGLQAVRRGRRRRAQPARFVQRHVAAQRGGTNYSSLYNYCYPN
jgi:hypothetical protein